MPFKILVHEYFTGGGWSANNMPSGLASEGLAMLYAVTEDFSKWEEAIVYTTLDKRLKEIPLTADSITIIESEEYQEGISALAKECDFALIIAPERDGILSGLNKKMKQSGTVSIGCENNAIRLTRDKWVCHKILSNAGLPVPETILETDSKLLSTSRYSALQIGFPLVIKPVDGVGCEGVNLAGDMDSLRDILKDNSACTDGFLLQEYVKGEHLSVSVLTTGNEFVLLSLNCQHIDEGIPFKYRGGEIMPPHETDYGLYNIIEEIIKAIPGLKGYIGIDLIRSEGGYKVIEINPRLTTSYIGLRKVINVNLAEAMFDAVTKGVLPEAVDINENKIFSKELSIDRSV